MNSANLENYGLKKDGTYEILGEVNRQTKTFSPTEYVQKLILEKMRAE